MLEGGCDLFLVETIFDTLNAKAAIFALDELMEDTGERLPVIVSGTVTDASGRILSGQTVSAFWHSVRHARPLAIGLNCALGAALMRPYIEELARVAGDTFVSCYPNAGLPNPMSETGFDETPEITGRPARRIRAGRFPEHRRRLLRHHAGPHRADRRTGRPLPAALRPSRRAVRRARSGLTAGSSRGSTAARRPFDLGRGEQRGPTSSLPAMAATSSDLSFPPMKLSGLEPVLIGAGALFVNIGERTNVTGSKAFARMILNGEFEEALAVARQQVENGAQIIDINMDEAMLDSKAAMVRFLNLIAGEPDIARVPIMIDSSKWERDRGRPAVHAGQGHRQLDLA